MKGTQGTPEVRAMVLCFKVGAESLVFLVYSVLLKSQCELPRIAIPRTAKPKP